jgi:hypothetical protein
MGLYSGVVTRGAVKVIASMIENGYEYLYWAYSVEKLGKNDALYFCRKSKHSELRTALSM